MDFIVEIDTALFYFLNGDISNSVFDKIMPYVTNIKNWLLVYIFLLGWLFWKGGTHGRIAAVSLIITIALTDQISSNLLKDLFGRIRPCHTLENINLLISCGSGKSMPSSHAANMFAAAVVMTYFYRKYIAIYFAIAAIIAFSRIYVGVHYPFDVLVGTIVGISTGSTVVFAAKIIEKRFFEKKE